MCYQPFFYRPHQYPRHHPCLSMSPALGLGVQLTQQLGGTNGLQVHMDVQQFKPNEITVTIIDDYAVVEAKHEDREDEHGLISRNFIRKYKLPKGYFPNQVTSTLSSDGVLTIKAPPPPKNEGEKNERAVQIQQTGPAHLNIKDNDFKQATQNGDEPEN